MNTENIALEKIFLDPNNFRYQKDLGNDKIAIEKISGSGVQKRIAEKIYSDNKIKDLEESILFNDFIYNEIIIVKKIGETGFYYVIEGNRRTAVLKKIFNSYETRELKDNLKKIIETGLEVKVVNEDYDEDLLMGMRHVTGIKPWTGFSKAKLIVKLHEEKKYSIEDIAKSLGNNNINDVRKRLYAYKLLSRMHDDGYTTGDISEYYNLFFEVIGKPAYRTWLGFSEEEIRFTNEDNTIRFYSWITDFTDEEGNTDTPIISNPQSLRAVADILFDDEALTTLEETRMVSEAIKNSAFIRHKEVSKTIKKIYSAVTDLSISDLEDLDPDIYELLKKSSSALLKNIKFIEFEKTQV